MMNNIRPFIFNYFIISLISSLITAQNLEKIIRNYPITITNEYKTNSNLREQLESFQIVYLRPDFSKPIVSISKIEYPEFIYDEVYDSNIVINYNELLFDYQWDKYFSRHNKIPNKITKSLSQFIARENLIIASYGLFTKDIVVFKRKNSMLYPVFICPMLLFGNRDAYFRYLPNDTLMIGYGGGDEGDYFGNDKYFVVNDSIFQLIKTVELQGIDAYGSSQNYFAECSKTLYYDQQGNISNSIFTSYAKNNDGSLVYKKINSDSLKVYGIDPQKGLNLNLAKKEYSTIYIPNKIVQISGPNLIFNIIIRHKGKLYLTHKNNFR